MADEQVWVAVADLHGHPGHLEGVLSYVEQRYSSGYRLALLGDYLDNGPDMPRLLELLISLQRRLEHRCVAIAGNHDLACLRSLGMTGPAPDPEWYARWCERYFSWHWGTPKAYGAETLEELAERMPEAHLTFLRGLPWFYDTGRYFFVHGGLHAGPIGPQRDALLRRELPVIHHHTPTWLMDKRLATVADPAWDRLVVSGHTREPGRGLPSAPHFVGPNRLCLSAEVDATEVLYAVILPEGRVLRVTDQGRSILDTHVLTLQETSGQT